MPSLVTRAALGAAAAVLLATPPAHAGCAEMRAPVKLEVRATIAGTLCRPAGAAPRAIQLLVHGSTYTRSYWDWPGHGGTYSWARTMRGAGWATLAIDRLGSGRSSRPDAGFVTYRANVRAVDQVADRVRRRWPRVRLVLVGHSYGSLVVAAVANRRRDVAAVVLTGATTEPGARATALAPCLVPARQAGYMTTRDGCRAGVFFDAASTDPQVIAEDEARKGTLTPGEVVGTPIAGGGTWPVRGIRAPALVAVGDRDGLFCSPATTCSSAAALAAAERPRWRRTRVSAWVQPETGHNLNLHRSAPAFFATVADWLRRHAAAR